MWSIVAVEVGHTFSSELQVLFLVISHGDMSCSATALETGRPGEVNELTYALKYLQPGELDMRTSQV